jgi:glycosyltransferase involved in cell wall biosynthesis
MQRRVKVAAFTGGVAVPSARFRVRQYVEPLRTCGVDVTELPAPLGRYPPASRVLRPLWGTAALGSLLPGVARSWRHDVTLFQRELVSTLLTLEPLARRPAVLDVDDAIYLLRGGVAARGLAERCVAVVCGNAYLAETFSRWSKRITILPTAVDAERFVPGPPAAELVVGWSGSSGGFGYLRAIEPALREVLRAWPKARLRVVADAPPELRSLPAAQVEFIRWSPEIEVAALQGMAVGLMPLEDSPWARGKCSFKMLTYMACGVPVVVSPVGMNVEVLAKGAVGLAASSAAEWAGAIGGLLEDAVLRRAMGEAGRRVVLGEYARSVIAPRLAEVLRTAAG